MPEITVREAAQIAKSEFLALNEQLDISDISIEEVELTDDENSWNITVGYTMDVFSRQRGYKKVRINAHTGAVVSIKFME